MPNPMTPPAMILPAAKPSVNEVTIPAPSWKHSLVQRTVMFS